MTPTTRVIDTTQGRNGKILRHPSASPPSLSSFTMATFDPAVILAILTAGLTSTARNKVEKDWKSNVTKRVNGWLSSRTTQTRYVPQLEWEANIAEYVMLLHRETRPARTTKASNTIPKAQVLKAGVPIYGPRFIPPSFIDTRLRGGKVKAETAYLRPINIIHPVYYPALGKCPHCGSEDIDWDSWNATGSREVHGVRREETALGYQLRHDKCLPDEGESGTRNRCFATTNMGFWRNWEHWEIPRGIPFFFSRSAVTRELFDLIIELRLLGTSGGLAENIKQLHLLEYHEHYLEYLQAYTKVYGGAGSTFFQSKVTPFSPPKEAGYNDVPITDDLIREVYMAFVERTRSAESDEYLRSLPPGICLGADNTFKAAGKATVVNAAKTRTKLMKGGILSVLNEVNEIVAWRFCQSASPAELGELLMGLKRRCEELGIPFPVMITVDNCCQVARDILKVFPDIQICLDVYHFMMRYLAAVLNGMNNSHRPALAADIRNAILKRSAEKDAPAQYWPRDEQESKICAVYDKYSQIGGVWSAAAHTVHAAQLKHLQKGCLSRVRQDIASDGSRIEGSHKGWNSIQRASASGLELQNALSHDFVLRRNIRVSFSRAVGTAGSRPFVRSTHGSHHTRLVQRVASMFNTIFHVEAGRTKSLVSQDSLHPILQIVASGEVFGLVSSQHNDTFGGLLTLKSEDTDQDQLLEQALETVPDAQELLTDLNIDPVLLFQPQQPNGIPRLVPLTSIPNLEPRSGAPELIRPEVAGPDERVSAALLSSKRKALDPPDVDVAPASGSPMTEADIIPRTKKPRVEEPSLEIHSGAEFYLFVDMRRELQWKASDMTSKKWANAVGEYNVRLARKVPGAIAKTPRALVNKLGEVERHALHRLATNDFKSKSGDETFWRQHCFAVTLLKPDPASTEGTVKAEKSNSRKVAVCTRCNKVMYPGPPGAVENHKKGYCSDGFKQKPPVGDTVPIPWPQPQGIFSAGSEFHPLPFLAVIRDLYEKVVVEDDSSNLGIEHEAFSLMLQRPGRVITVDGRVLFKLFTGYDVPAGDRTPDDMFVDHEGTKYLRIDALTDASDLQSTT
ncbi:hypothetical protein C8R46DRAFT_1236100 [Mycena filopes]|nr:hypothetical protein C8R46DRAFT_1236100 [Mycena filopes]